MHQDIINHNATLKRKANKSSSIQTFFFLFASH